MFAGQTTTTWLEETALGDLTSKRMTENSQLSDCHRQSSQPPIPPPLPSQIDRSTRFKVKARNGMLEGIISTLEKGPEHISNSRIADALAGFESGYIFLYGSLMDDEVLKHVLQLQDTPHLEKATIHGYKTKLWGIYPALIPETNSIVRGMAWKASNKDQIMRLVEYETKAYKICSIPIIRDDGQVVDGNTFCWAGEPDCNDLKDGTFDLKKYQTYFKQALISRRQRFELNE